MGSKRQRSGKLEDLETPWFSKSHSLHRNAHIQGPGLGLVFSAAILKFLTIFEHETPYFHFALGPVYYIAGIAEK